MTGCSTVGLLGRDCLVLNEEEGFLQPLQNIDQPTASYLPHLPGGRQKDVASVEGCPGDSRNESRVLINVFFEYFNY
jgi:hypothetical protein